ncbi:EAL domain-containing protein [Aquisalimonas sp. 2447]|uniref:EAL domain-containing protein n=1 Tax=Aquisalimonas sp. 2447 TaxID=2740807 RepID=UPI0014327162|nr:EAL domain-containing protein [Aquisalimonas sp. 2447]QIT55672.1 EAL domain-containing protein [Aquisalimonas sp. 2447]
MREGLQEIVDDLAAIAGESLAVADARAPDQPVVYVNPQFERLSGWPADAILGSNCRVLQGEEFDQPARWLMREAIRDARAMRGLMRNYDRHGRAFINEMTVLPLGGSPGEPECFAGFLRDVSSLQGQRSDGMPMVTERRREQGIETLVQRHGGGAVDDQVPARRYWLQVAATPADRIFAGCLDQHLEFESQWREAHPFTPDDLLAQVRRRAERAAPWLRLQVTRESRFPEHVHGVLQVLTDVLAGVLGLLCRFHPVSEVRVDLGLERGQEGGMAPLLTVSPSLTGNVEASVSEVRDDAAWGALAAMSFVEMAREARLGGAVLSVDPEFTFTLRLEHTISLHDVHGGAARDGARPLQVLVGEDNPVNWKMLRGLLERDGHSVRVAEDGEQVLAAVAEQRPDVVFLDLYMPGCDGFEAARRLRQREVDQELPGLPIIAVTAAGMEEAREQSLSVGMDAIVTKPVSHEHLRRVLWEQVGRRGGDGDGEQAGDAAAAEQAELDRALRALDYDVPLFRDMLEAFSRDFPERVRNLQTALEQGDTTEAGFLAHTIKGGLSNFSALEGVGLANALHDQIDRQQMVEAGATLRLLEDAVAGFTEWAESALDARDQRELVNEQRREDRRVEAEVAELSVLVVEDAADTRLMLTEFLRRDGYRVFAVEDGERALQHLEHQVPDLILMDCVMPGMDGLEACRRIKQRDEFADLPVLIITALNDEASASEAIRAGATDFTTKPIFLPVLRQRLRQMALSRERHQRIKYLAYHDALTGLPNRASFNEGLNGLLDDARDRGVQHALVYLDLDQFKIVNDTCGHGAGDELLARLGRVLAAQVRERDMVARLGGDEFGVLLQNCGLEDAVGVAEKLVEAARNYVFVWQDQAFFVGASAGLVAVTADSVGAEDLLSAADTACYSAKSNGRDRVQVYRDEDGHVLQESELIQQVPRINRALEEDRFVLYRQQIVPLFPGADEMPHYEVLVRMLGEDGELVAPGSFIPSAERYQVMPRVDRWVVRRALQGIRQMHLEQRQPARYSINLSGTTVGEKGFADFLEARVRDTGVPPEWLCFEITETATIRRLETAVEFIQRIRALGCSFALDDFGAGLSSFGYLKTLPVDYIKIDGRFVRELLLDSFDQAMVEAMQRIGTVMGIETIAEFVENEEVMDRLRDIGVRYAQGFGVHKPEPFID